MLACAISTSIFSAMGTAGAKEIILPISGQYKTIDTKLATATIKLLQSKSKASQDKAIKAIEAAPDRYAPPVLYQLSATLFQRGDKDKAAFWFYAGQLRGRYDANRCGDLSARSAIAVMNDQFGQPINQYMFSNLSKLEKVVPEVLAWDKKTAHNYDQRWINLHGMGSMLTSLGDKDQSKRDPGEVAMSLPQAEWPQIEEETRKNYLKGFQETLSEAKLLAKDKKQ